MCACTYVHVCVSVCVSVCVEPLSHALTMLHCPSDRNSNLCKDSFSPFVSSISFSPSLLLLSLFFLQCGFHSSGLSCPFLPLSHPFLPSCTVRLCPSFALSLPLSVLHAPLPPSGSLSLPFFPRSLLSCIDLHFFLLHFAVPLSLCCQPSILCIHLTLSFSALFHVLPLLVRLTPEVVKSEKKMSTDFTATKPSSVSLPPFSPSSGLK